MAIYKQRIPGSWSSLTILIPGDRLQFHTLISEMSKVHDKAEQPSSSVDDVSSGLVDDTVIELDPELERRTLRKFDLYLLPTLSVILLLAYLDRSNLVSLIVVVTLRCILLTLHPAGQCQSLWLRGRLRPRRQPIQHRLNMLLSSLRGSRSLLDDGSQKIRRQTRTGRSNGGLERCHAGQRLHPQLLPSNRPSSTSWSLRSRTSSLRRLHHFDNLGPRRPSKAQRDHLRL